MTIHRSPMFVFSNDAGPTRERSWARAQSTRLARTLVVVEDRPQSTKPAGIRAIRTVRRDGVRRATTPVRGWRR